MSLKEIRDRCHPGRMMYVDFKTLSQAVKDIQQLLRLIAAYEKLETAARNATCDWADAEFELGQSSADDAILGALEALDLTRLELWGEDVTGITDEPFPDSFVGETWASQIVNDPMFKECSSCAAKPGSPALCQGCLHNRRVIGVIREKLEEKRRENTD